MHAQSRDDSEIFVFGNDSSGYAVEVAAMPRCGDQDGRSYREHFGRVVAACRLASLYAPFRTGGMRRFANAKHLLVCLDDSQGRIPILGQILSFIRDHRGLLPGASIYS
jgi:hypothetical protein